MWKRLIMIGTLGAFAGIFLITQNPVQSRMLKIAFLGCLVGLWIGFTILAWNRKPMRMISLILPLLAAIPFILPGAKIDEGELRGDYVRRLASFEGTEYLWGGESARGIDCSGLPRRAFRDALLAYGVKHFNGRALRSYLDQWWFDASAKALAEGYRGYTLPLATTGKIYEMNFTGLVPGDLAVTSSRSHILVYVGDDQWIQADPGIGAVVTLNGKTDKNGWFQATVTTHRWKMLEPNNSENEEVRAANDGQHR